MLTQELGNKSRLFEEVSRTETIYKIVAHLKRLPSAERILVVVFQFGVSADIQSNQTLMIFLYTEDADYSIKNRFSEIFKRF